MSRKRWALLLAALVPIVVGAAFLVVQSSWFYGKVRARIVSTVANATGGRVAIGSFRFDWKSMRAEVRDFTLAGTEPPGKPPLVHADAVSVGLKIVSLLKQDVDIQYLEVQNPRVYLIVYPDGSTNIPRPKVKRSSGNAMEDIIKLAIDRFRLRNGTFEIDAQGKTPFDVSGRNLNAALAFQPAGPRYAGQVSVEQLVLGAAGHQAAWSFTANASFEKNRISVASARLATGATTIQLAGAIEDLSDPHGSFRFDAHGDTADAARILRTQLLDRGVVDVAGNIDWEGGSRFQLHGKMRASEIQYRGAYIQLRGFRADGAVSASPDGIDLSSLRLSGNAAGVAVAGEVAAVAIRAHDLDLKGIALQGLGGAFRGQGHLRDLQSFKVEGRIQGIEARRAVALYSSAALPWNSLVSGDVQAEGLLQRKNELRASGGLVLEPAPGSAPVNGQVAAVYDTRTGILDLGRSHISLPSSSADFSGSLGRQLRVQLESRNLDDLLPVLGRDAAALPVQLRNGDARFEGAITGKLDDPLAAGRLTVTNFTYAGRPFDALSADVTASARNVALRNASLARGAVRAQFEAAVDLHDGAIDDSSQLAASAAIRNAALPGVAALLTSSSVPASGAVSISGQANGTIGNPLVKGDFNILKGDIAGEPFDRLSASVTYSNRVLTLAAGTLSAGANQLHFSANYQHAAANLESGTLRFQAESNDVPLETIALFHNERPDAQGQIHFIAAGAAQLTPSNTNGPDVRLSELRGDLTAQGLRIDSRDLGSVHITANSQGQILRAHIDANLAASSVKGDGEWRLEGDYPGTAAITFSKIDFAHLRNWILPPDSGIADRFAGSADGEIHIQGPLAQWQAIQAQLRIPHLEVSASTGGASSASLALHNSGPIVATLAHSVVNVDSARLVGHDTDLAIAGRLLLQPQPAPDLRVTGRVDLAIVHDFDPDFRASGVITADATIRGTLASPQIGGRTEFHNANFNIADLPNGLTNANGVILFSGDRATIQSFSGETGGGKVDLSGVAGYGPGQSIFRLHARVQQVRVRYPEGVSTVADASLNLTGTLDRSMLAGTVTVRRTGFNLQSDFSSLIAQSAQPVQTPSARTGFLGGLGFDIQINTAPDIEFQSELAQDLQVEANLRLRGTFSNPALLGRVNITQGQIIFFGAHYTIGQGSISFFNAVRVEPILDVDLETKARGIDITLSVTGPLNKLNLTPRSDPPLQFNEIVALLATGRAPTNDPTMLAGQATAPQSWQQMGASALLGQAIASPVAGRLQRFFGISQLRIDPSFPGVENTPQARLTLEQQITPDITFTYITNVTTTNQQLVRVEWAFSKQWSVVALREENGVFGIDFFFKKRF